jgi:putative transposase
MKVFTFCLMPNHFHMLISPADSGVNISRFIGSFKSKATRIGWKYGMGEKMWQGRFYDHVLRPNEPIKDVCEYILNNPVRKNLVKSWEDYKFCGFLDSVPA